MHKPVLAIEGPILLTKMAGLLLFLAEARSQVTCRRFTTQYEKDSATLGSQYKPIIVGSTPLKKSYLSPQK